MLTVRLAVIGNSVAFLAIAVTAAFPARSHAQPMTLTCTDHDSRAVVGIQAMDGVLARAVIDATGRRVIRYDPRPVTSISAQQHLFVYAHECGHHALGHNLGGQPFSVTEERDADCYGIRTLMSKAGVIADDVQMLQDQMQALGPNDARRLPWQRRSYSLVSCVTNAATDQTSNTHPMTDANACVDHTDADNQIVVKSRDGRSLTGVYSVANHCARDVTCRLTVEIGTLPDTDADAGSFFRFHPQKTRAEQRVLKAGAKEEFRFQETTDAAPTGESIDFRVSVTCG